jgi:hypothetical protein
LDMLSVWFEKSAIWVALSGPTVDILVTTVDISN